MKAFVPLAVAAALLAGAVPGLAQNTRNTGVTINAQLQALLRDGYEIKAGFAEAGVPYVLLQKGPSAYLCRGGGVQTCEKLN